jgi:3-hydroxyisobutyrate dehydrogenase
MASDALKPPARIGVVGLGLMGVPMARNLLKAGFTLAVFDANAQAVRDFCAGQPDVLAPPSLRELARSCAAVITMLPNGAIVREVVLDGQDNLAAGLAEGAIVIDMSSSSPVGTRDLGARLAERAVALIDAPVSGGVKRAIDGSLAIMAGGDGGVIDRCEALLSSMGQQIFRTGGLGTGHAMKALNNYVSAAGFAAAAEAVLAGTRFGLDPATVVSVLNASTGRNNSTENKFPQHVLTRKFAAGFSLGLMVKDLRTAIEVARATGMPAPMAETTLEQWARSEELLGSQADHTMMARYIEHLAGSTIADGEVGKS